MPNNVTIAKLQDKSVTITSNGTTTISPDSGYTAIHNVNLSVNVGGDVEEKDVNFYDYDGKRLYSYTLSEAKQLTELPELPDHSDIGLDRTSEHSGWNWILSEITGLPEGSRAEIGANYDTLDKETHIFITIPSDDMILGFPGISLSYYADIDWGDGTVDINVTGSSAKHSYSSRGNYEVILKHPSNGGYVGFNSLNGCKINFGEQSYSEVKNSYVTRIQIGSRTFRLSSDAHNQFTNSLPALETLSMPKDLFCSPVLYYSYSLEYVVIPRLNNSYYRIGSYSGVKKYILPYNFTLGEYMFYYNRATISLFIVSNLITSIPISCFNSCDSLKSFDIPSSATTIGGSAFSNCKSLAYMYIPSSVTTIGEQSFNNCYCLVDLKLNEGLISIGSSAFSYCGFTSVVIPSTVTSIGSSAFNSSPLKNITVLPQSPPTIQTSVFKIDPELKLYVPYSADHSILNAYKTASNWSTYADYMEELPAS